MTTTDLYPYLIIIGSSILIAAAWLLHRYRMQVRHTQALILLNEQLGYDLPNFLRQCWPTLQKGGFAGISWQLDWFGTEIAEEAGITGPQLLERRFAVQEITLLMKLYRLREGWEEQYFSIALADNFFLLVQMNLWIKLGTVQGAFDQAAKMTVFLKHDVKNMVQLLSLSADQLQNTPDGHENKLLGNLREAIPAVRDRAEHMLRALSEKPGKAAVRQPGLVGKTSQSLDKVLQQAATIYELSVSITGEASVPIEKEHLLSIVDNLLGNYSRQARKQHAKRPELRIHIEKGKWSVVTTIMDVHGQPFLWPERLFEPFWSEHGEGRGIGLYQARQLAKAAGGDLTATAGPDRPLVFSLILPVPV